MFNVKIDFTEIYNKLNLYCRSTFLSGNIKLFIYYLIYITYLYSSYLNFKGNVITEYSFFLCVELIVLQRIRRYFQCYA